MLVTADRLIALGRGLIESAYCRAPARQLDDQEIDAIDRIVEEFFPLWDRANR